MSPTIKVTPQAKEELQKFIQEKPESAIRLLIQGYGWGGPRLGMVLDEPTEEDHSYNVEGICWIIAQKDEHHILGKGGIRVDHVTSWFGSGFQISDIQSFGCC